MPEFPPIAHVAVTVTDLERSTRWYSGLLAAEPVLDEDEQAGGFTTPCSRSTEGSCSACIPTPMPPVTDSTSIAPAWIMWPSPAVTAMSCRGWAARLDELGIAHGGIKDAHYGSGVSFRDPDGIALEFFAPPA